MGGEKAHQPPAGLHQGYLPVGGPTTASNSASRHYISTTISPQKKKNISTTIDCRDSGNISISLVESQHNHAHPTRSNLPSHDRVENLRIQVSHQTTRAMILEPGPPPGQGINSCLKPKIARLPDGRSASSIEENDKNTRRRR